MSFPEDSVVCAASSTWFTLEDFLVGAETENQLDAAADTGSLDYAISGPTVEPPGSIVSNAEDAYDIFYGDSPLSSPPTSPPTSRCTTPVCTTPVPSLEYEGLGKRPASPKGFSNSKSRRDKKKAKRQRAERRRAHREQNPESASTPAEAIAQKYVSNAAEQRTAYNTADIPSGSSGFKAVPDKKDRVYTLNELISRGFKLIKWDGRSPKPVVDSKGLVVAVLAGGPDDPGWDHVHQSAYEVLQNSAPHFHFTSKFSNHRRGNFPAINAGISFGGGQMAPGNLCHTPARALELRKIMAHKSFIRLAGFASSAFATWMPKLYGYYRSIFDGLLGHHSKLRCNFSNSVWAAAAFNFGPKTVTAKHRDFANLPFGICAVTALGRYDPVKGGHVVLWEMGLVIEFPPGSTVLLPSAAISHSNTPIAANECRASFTQYTAGGLFRWAEHGYQTDANYMRGMSKAQLDALQVQNAARRVLGLSLFSTFSSLRCPSPTPSS